MSEPEATKLTPEAIRKLFCDAAYGFAGIISGYGHANVDPRGLLFLTKNAAPKATQTQVDSIDTEIDPKLVIGFTFYNDELERTFLEKLKQQNVTVIDQLDIEDKSVEDLKGTIIKDHRNNHTYFLPLVSLVEVNANTAGESQKTRSRREILGFMAKTATACALSFDGKRRIDNEQQVSMVAYAEWLTSMGLIANIARTLYDEERDAVNSTLDKITGSKTPLQQKAQRDRAQQRLDSFANNLAKQLDCKPPARMPILGTEEQQLSGDKHAR